MITYHKHIYQGSDEWFALRRGILTASEMKLIVTPTLKVANNEKTRAHLYELLAQRITEYVEPCYVSDDMMRGQEDEIYAREAYSKHFAPVAEVGFVTNDKWGFTLGYSPDGLVGDDGLIECKSRRQKYHVETILNDCIPADYMIQLQTGLLVTERKWIDFISYCGGLPMFVKRVFPDAAVQNAIVEAAKGFHEQLEANHTVFKHQMTAMKPLIHTERVIREEIFV